MSAEVRVIHADGVITGDAEAIRDGAVVVSGDGVVLDVGRATEVLPRHAGAKIERIAGVVFPGLVNAHTHIELSVLRGRIAGGKGFLPWVGRFVATRTEVMEDEEAQAISLATDDLDAFATTAVGDVTNRLTAVKALARRGIGGATFHEVFGIKLEPLRQRIAALPAEIEEVVGPWPGTDLAYAVAPHTLYTTHLDVVAELAGVARARSVVTSLHLAEHPGERRALESGDGPIVDWLSELTRTPREGFRWPHSSPVALADKLGALGPHVLAVHMTDVHPDELVLVHERGAPVVLCPRSNLYIELKLPPLLAMRAAGIEPALGTDSLASNASLDVLAEARALADRFPEVPARELLQMATWNGARALRRADLGRIAKGSRPGLAAVEDGPVADPCAFLLAKIRAPRRWVVRRAVLPSPCSRPS